MPITGTGEILLAMLTPNLGGKKTIKPLILVREAIFQTFVRIDKFTILPSPICKAVVTDNWILLIGQWPWNFNIAHQSDVTISLVHSQQHQLSTDGEIGGSQYLTIEVSNRRPNTMSFRFR
jgi:hypothetical protein